MPGLHELFERFGVLIVFINTLLHELAVPIPLTPTVLVAGAASSEALAFFCLVMAVVAGTVIGNAVWFAAGRRFGASVLGFLCRFSLSPDTCVAKSADGFGRWGAAFFFIGRFLPGISLVAPPVAGALGMSWRKFLVLTALSAMVWATVVILLGAALQRAVLAALAALGAVPAGIWVAAALVVVGYVLWRIGVRRRAAKALAAPRLAAPELAGALQSSRPPLVIDVRSATMKQILVQRIPGAVSLALPELERYPLRELAGRSVVLYCTCPNEASAAAGAQVLRRRGRAGALVLRGGLAGWIHSGYAVETIRSDVAPDTQRLATDIDAPAPPATLKA